MPKVKLYRVGQWILCFVPFLIASCVEEPDESIDFGSQYSPAEIQEIINEALGPETAEVIRKGEFVAIETTQSVRGGSPIPIEIVGLTVTEREETEDYIDFTFLQEEVEFIDGEPRHSIRSFEQRIAKSSSTQILGKTIKREEDASLRLREISLLPQGLINRANEEELRQTFHNLKVQRHWIDPPRQVIESENCGGLSPCRLLVTDLNYDVRIWEGSQSEKVSVFIRISAQAPYLARILDNCQTISLRIENQRALVRVCETVRAFRFGEELVPEGV